MTTKRVIYPEVFDSTSNTRKTTKYIGYTEDGYVVFNDEAIKLMVKEVPVDVAHQLERELLTVTYEANRCWEKAAGLYEFVSEPLPNGEYRVFWYGKSAIFRAITNRVGHPCTVCKATSPSGATSYVFDRPAPNTPRHTDMGNLRNIRVCESCMKPELRAAVLGAALIGNPSTPPTAPSES